VTGMGIVCPLGVGVGRVWDRLVEEGATSAVRKLTPEDLNERDLTAGTRLLAKLPSQVVARVPMDEMSDCPWAGGASLGQRHVSPFISFALVAAAEALADANFKEGSLDREATGVGIGVGMSGTAELSEAGVLLEAGEVRRLSPFMIPRLLPNMAAGAVSLEYGFLGPLLCPSTACASGASAIGDAFRVIKSGHASVMVSGGAEACVGGASFAGFSRLRALSTNFNSTPTLASRPFDSFRDGFVLGEGAGVLVLEELDHAIKRGARIYAEVCGYGCSGDAYHFTQPPPDGAGAELAMRKALKEAGALDCLHEVSYINAHATSTPLGDTAEQHAIAKVFGKLATSVLSEDKERGLLAVSSTKGATGHLLGAAGGVEAIFTVLALKKCIVPPTLNLHDVHPPILGNIVGITAKHRNRGGFAISNSFGFGGVNVSLVFKEFAQEMLT